MLPLLLSDRTGLGWVAMHMVMPVWLPVRGSVQGGGLRAERSSPRDGPVMTSLSLGGHFDTRENMKAGHHGSTAVYSSRLFGPNLKFHAK